MTTDDQPKTAETPAEIVKTFTNPVDEFRAMARIQKGEAITWGIFLNRHARRARRNAHRLAIARDVALLTRSEEGYGSEQAAGVAQRSGAAAENIFDRLMGTNGTNPKGDAKGAKEDE